MIEHHNSYSGKVSRLLSVLILILASACAEKDPKPFGTIPSKAQVAWQRMERNLFVCFGPNSFSGKEWGDGTETEDLFNPTDLDCRQWVRTARDAGFTQILKTAVSARTWDVQRFVPEYPLLLCSRHP